MSQPILITGNPIKLRLAKAIFDQYGLEFDHQKLELPEIQAETTEEIAMFSAKWAAKELNGSVIVNDVGYYIHALGGFPGPFIKYINKWLQSSDILKMMTGNTDREMQIHDVTAYCDPGHEPIVFTSKQFATITETAVTGTSSMIDEITLLNGFDKVQSSVSLEDKFNYWVENVSNYHDMAKYLISKSK